jgi:hypothetical protein
MRRYRKIIRRDEHYFITYAISLILTQDYSVNLKERKFNYLIIEEDLRKYF